MIKKSSNWIRGEAQITSNQKLPSRDGYLHAKDPRDFWFSSSDIDDQRREVQLVTPNQKMLPSLDDYLHAKNLREQLIPSRDIDDEIILQSEWLRAF